MPYNPYSFTNEQGVTLDWSNLVGEVVPGITGHNRPIAQDELAVICARRDRAASLHRALLAMKNAGETQEALRLTKQIIGN
jgi:hypothetical protein